MSNKSTAKEVKKLANQANREAQDALKEYKRIHNVNKNITQINTEYNEQLLISDIKEEFAKDLMKETSKSLVNNWYSNHIDDKDSLNSHQETLNGNLEENQNNKSVECEPTWDLCTGIKGFIEENKENAHGIVFSGME